MLARAGVVEPADGVDAYRAVTAALADELAALPVAAAEQVTHNGLTVRQLVAHLTAIDGAFLDALTSETPQRTHLDSTVVVEITDAALAEVGDATFADVVRSWDDTRDKLQAAAAAAPSGTPGRSALGYAVDDALVIRAFETWTHLDDIRQTVDRPGYVPTAPVLRSMADLSMRYLPSALAVTGRARPAESMKVVLTGPGGRSWDVPLAPGDAADGGAGPIAVMTADIVAWCHRFADRLAPEGLAIEVAGDHGRRRRRGARRARLRRPVGHRRPAREPPPAGAVRTVAPGMIPAKCDTGTGEKHCSRSAPAPPIDGWGSLTLGWQHGQDLDITGRAAQRVSRFADGLHAQWRALDADVLAVHVAAAIFFVGGLLSLLALVALPHSWADSRYDWRISVFGMAVGLCGPIVPWGRWHARAQIALRARRARDDRASAGSRSAATSRRTSRCCRCRSCSSGSRSRRARRSRCCRRRGLRARHRRARQLEPRTGRHDRARDADVGRDR